jgi:nitrate reductase delta subunit
MQILKVIGLLMEYPDELLWECKDDALALVASDAPMLSDFSQELLNAPLLDKQAEWCEIFDRGRATSLLLFEHVHAESVTGARRWLICWRSMKRSGCS